MMEEKRAPSSANVVRAFQDYITRIVSIPGMKALVLDEETMKMVSLVYSQSEILAKEVYMTEGLHLKKKSAEAEQPMHHLKAVMFVRPIEANVDRIKRMIKSSRFKEYHLFFSNVLPPEYLESIARADDMDLVKRVEEYFADYYAETSILYHVGLKASRGLEKPSLYLKAEKSLYERNLAGVLSVLLALKRRPVVRYQASSESARLMALDVTRRMKEESSLFHFQQSSTPLLLIVDRRDDPVTPLLSQWTYTAMVHELLGIEGSRVSVPHFDNRGNITKSEEAVLSPLADDFYKANMHLNFGDLAVVVRDMVEKWKAKSKVTANIDSIDDLMKLSDNFPELRRESSQVHKHLAVVSALIAIQNSRRLMEVSELEQDMVCNTSSHSEVLERLLSLLQDEESPESRERKISSQAPKRVLFMDKLRLVCLYALRFEGQRNELPQLLRVLRDKADEGNSGPNVTRDQQQKTELNRQYIKAVESLLEYAGNRQRQSDLFSTRSVLGSAFKNMSKTFSFKGVECVYTQHKPQLLTTLEELRKPKSTKEFPPADQNANLKEKFPLVIVYMIGGVTYEEEAAIAQLNKNDPSTKVILGGSYVHNSKSFLDDVLEKSKESNDVLVNIDI